MTALYAKTDLCTDAILDFIRGGWTEKNKRYAMEADGNYNAIIGNAKSTTELSTYTLKEIYIQQARLLSSREPSSAIGGYQFVHATLSRLADQAKCNSAVTSFTPELQDKFAWLLLCGRGYQSWWTKRISDSDFAHNLSMEWASLPDPFSGGKSHYDGVGPNHAGCQLSSFMNMITRARTLQAAAAR